MERVRLRGGGRAMADVDNAQPYVRNVEVPMDQALQTLLMERLGASGTEPGGGDGGGLASLVSSQFSDPLIGAVVTSLLNRRMQGSNDVGADDVHVHCRIELAQAKRAVHTMRQLLEPASEIVTYVAEIFGACPTCWGLESACAQCHGRGRAGWSEPSAEEMMSWVEPALERLGLQVVLASPQQDDVHSGGDLANRKEP
jgi:hypothetical protein